MNFVVPIAVIVLILLAGTSGVAKVMLAPQEIGFFGEAGFSHAAIVVLGAIHLLGAGLLVLTQTRAYGAILLAIVFLISSAIIFAGGQTVFGFVSLIPALLSAWLVWVQFRKDTAA